MKKYFITLLMSLMFLFIGCDIVFSSVIQTHTRYSNGNSVTDANLDGNLDYIRNVVNGDLDNNNAAVSRGFRFIEILGTLPIAGTRGRIVFLTSDNVLYFDDGTQFVPYITISGTPSIGDIIYYNGTAWVRLSKNTTATRYLANTGSSNIPKWDQINLVNGLTIASQATGDLIYATSATAFGRLGIGTSGQVLKVSASSLPSWGTGSNVQVFTSSGTFTAPAGITKVYLTMIGGGGGGGGSGTNTSVGGGGGSGAYVINRPYTVIAGNNYTVTVGAGGTGGTDEGVAGTAGGNTSFDSTVICNGGSGGIGGTAGGAGGAGGTGGFAPSGGTGGGYTFAGTAGANRVSSTAAGGGGGSPFGSGTSAVDGAVAPSATANSGAGSAGNEATASGGNGGSGIVVVMY